MTDDNNNNKTTVKFAPGVLEQLEAELSPEDVQEFLNALAQMSEDGSLNDLYEASEPIDMERMKKEDPELHATIRAQLDGCFDQSGNTPTVH